MILLRPAYFLSFLLASAYFYSNVWRFDSFSLGHYFTFLSIIISFLFLNYRVIIYFLLFSILYFISTFISITSDGYILISFYKLCSFLPIFVIFSRFEANFVFWGAFSSLSSSIIISIFLILLGYSEDKFILYETPNFFRYAALTIEPGSLAKGAIIVYFLYVLSFRIPQFTSKVFTSFLLIPTFSTHILIKVIFDFLYQQLNLSLLL